MIDSHELFKYFLKKNISFFSGVPDSVLKNFTRELDFSKKIEHYICVNEGSAVGMAIGNYLKTNRRRPDYGTPLPENACGVPSLERYSVSRRCFLRDRFLANACFARRLSPGFR